MTEREAPVNEATREKREIGNVPWAVATFASIVCPSGVVEPLARRLRDIADARTWHMLS